MVDWVVNICATFSLCTPFSCFLAFARPLSVFRWTWCQGLCISSSHACSWKKESCVILNFPVNDVIKHWLELIVVIVQKENYLKWYNRADYAKFVRDDCCTAFKTSHFFQVPLLASPAPDTQLCSSLSPRGRCYRLWCPHSLKQVDRRRHE